jgi:hypothetical protein
MDRESSRVSRARVGAGDGSPPSGSDPSTGGRPPAGARPSTDGHPSPHGRGPTADPRLTGGDPAAAGAPRLVINPRQDAGFVEACSVAMEAAPAVPRALQEALRDEYPQATVEPRALSGESLRVWYVYRDGHWVSS